MLSSILQWFYLFRLWLSFSGTLILLVLNNQISVINCFTGGNAPSQRSDAAFTVTPQGKVFLFGGTTSGGFSNDLFLYDPFNNTWQQIVSGSSAPTERGYSTLWMAPDGQLYLYGGYIPQYARKWDNYKLPQHARNQPTCPPHMPSIREVFLCLVVLCRWMPQINFNRGNASVGDL